jgi:hypothetical protein
MNLTVEINKAEIRTLEWILELFAKPEIWSPYMIEKTIRAYKDKLQQSNELCVNEMKSRNEWFEDRYCDANGVTITDADPGL